MDDACNSSPISEVGKWRSPVLLIHGDDDRNVMFGQSIDLAESWMPIAYLLRSPGPSGRSAWISALCILAGGLPSWRPVFLTRIYSENGSYDPYCILLFGIYFGHRSGYHLLFRNSFNQSATDVLFRLMRAYVVAAYYVS